ELVLNLIGFGGQALKEFGADYECAGGNAHASFNAAASLALLDELDEAGIFELAQVVIDFLSGNAEPVCEPRRRIGVLEVPEYVASDRRQERRDSLLVRHHRYRIRRQFCHNAPEYTFDKFSCQINL